MKKLEIIIQFYEKRLDLYLLIFYYLKPRVFTNKVITKEVVKEQNFEIPPTTIDKQKIIHYVSALIEEKIPKPEPLLTTKVVYKKVTEKQVISQPGPRTKDIFLDAQEAYFGHGRTKNLKEAHEIYQEAENRGYIKASNCLGLMYLKGEGVSQDFDKAYSHFKKAISSNVPKDDPKGEGKEDGYYWLGHMHYHNLISTNTRDSNLSEAIRNFEVAGKMGQSQALCDLGVIYESGLLGKQDLNKSKQFYEESVKKNNPMAMDNLGVFLLQHEENFVNDNCQKRAFELFEKARSLGYKKSLTNLGIMYLKGIHVQKDLVNAKDLFKRAAGGDQPDLEAKYYLAYYKLKEASMSQDQNKFEEVADELRFVLAQNKQHSDANYYMGFLYENGLGTDKDTKSALKHYKKAMEFDTNNSKAKVKVANFHMTGDGGAFPDKMKGFQLYREASEQGNSDAKLALG